MAGYYDIGMRDASVFLSQTGDPFLAVQKARDAFFRNASPWAQNKYGNYQAYANADEFGQAYDRALNDFIAPYQKQKEANVIQQGVNDQLAAQNAKQQEANAKAAAEAQALAERNAQIKTFNTNRAQLGVTNASTDAPAPDVRQGATASASGAGISIIADDKRRKRGQGLSSSLGINV